jgi:hypothetical protein
LTDDAYIPVVYEICELVPEPVAEIAREDTRREEGVVSKNPVGAVLAIIALVGFMATVLLLGFVQIDIPQANRDFFNMGFGAMISFATMGMGYFIGSSKGSADKSDESAASSAQKDATIQNLIAPGVIK